jgi:hypothetical protein
MDPYERSRGNSGGDFVQQLRGLAISFVNYLKTRTAEHWLFFAIGVIIGLWIG